MKWTPLPGSVVAIAAGGSYSWVDNERRISISGFEGTADSSPDFWSGAVRLHMEYQFVMGDLYLTPYQDFDFVFTRTPGYSESGAGALDLDIESNRVMSVSSTKAVELGSRMHVAHGLDLRTYASAGVTIARNQDWTTTGTLAGAPAGTGTLSTTIPIDKYYGRLGFGMQLVGEEWFDLRLEYDGAVSGHSNSHIGSLRFGYRF